MNTASPDLRIYPFDLRFTADDLADAVPAPLQTPLHAPITALPQAPGRIDIAASAETAAANAALIDPPRRTHYPHSYLRDLGARPLFRVR
jgi:hypothetical protein